MRRAANAQGGCVVRERRSRHNHRDHVVPTANQSRARIRNRRHRPVRNNQRLLHRRSRRSADIVGVAINRKAGVGDFETLLAACVELGARFIVCEMGLRSLGIAESAITTYLGGRQ